MNEPTHPQSQYEQDPIEYDVDMWNASRPDRKIVHIDCSEFCHEKPCISSGSLSKCAGMDDTNLRRGAVSKWGMQGNAFRRVS